MTIVQPSTILQGFQRACLGIFMGLLAYANTLACQPPAKSAEPKDSRSVTDLLDDLEREIAGLRHPSDAWLKIMMQIHERGESARDDLIHELDTNQSDVMMRALAFLMRASGDPCYVPALIRAIPKTLLPPGSDMGLLAQDAKCIAFAQKYDLDEENGKNDFGLGRPVREVLGAIHKLAGQDLGDKGLFNVFLEGTSNQARLKQQLYDRAALKWSRWWSIEAPNRGVAAAYRTVNLPPPKNLPATTIPADARLNSDSSHSNWVLSPVQRPDSEIVFLDLDTGLMSSLPDHWKKGNIEENMDDIYQWAKEEGFDLMGREADAALSNKGKDLFIIQPIHMDLWELPEDYWKKSLVDVTLESLRLDLTSTDVLLHYDEKNQKHDPDKTATFLFQTSDGTPGIIYLGISVNASKIPAGRAVMSGDLELDPMSFRTGRRMGFSFLRESSKAVDKLIK